MKVEIPEGWRVLPVGTIIEKGDKFVNAFGKWIETCDYDRPVKKGFPYFGGYGEWAGIYIRKIEQPKDTKELDKLLIELEHYSHDLAIFDSLSKLAKDRLTDFTTYHSAAYSLINCRSDLASKIRKTKEEIKQLVKRLAG